MKFSIVIPTYNRSNTISKAIESCLNQIYVNFEIIIIDDGSTDNTELLVNEFKDERIKYFKTQNNERGAARNLGLKNSSGDWITFLDSDDIYYQNYLKNAYTFITNHSFVKFFHQAFEFVDDKRNLIQQYRIHKPKDILKGNFLACMGVFGKKEVFEEYKFNEDRTLSGSEDYELWIRIYSKYKLEINPIVSSAMVCHDQRSEYLVDANKLQKRILFLNELINKNKLLPKYQKRKIIANVLLYKSITCVEFENEIVAFNALVEAVNTNVSILFSYKTYVCIYHIIKLKINKFFK